MNLFIICSNFKNLYFLKVVKIFLIFLKNIVLTFWFYILIYLDKKLFLFINYLLFRYFVILQNSL